MKDINRLHKVEEFANESSFVKISGRAMKVGSLIYLGNRCISSAVNSNKTHTKVKNIMKFYHLRKRRHFTQRWRH